MSRTLLDLAATVRPSELERALAQAEGLQLYDHCAIEGVITRCNGHRGTKTLAKATRREPKWTRNEWEAEFLQLIRNAGLPEPLVNDGTRAAFRHDRAKDAALTAAGHRVLRFTKDVEPELVVRRLRALLA
ncbi:MAG: hypothetical protein ACXWZZ_14605 [Solirubrobacteraceae bacterium]